MPIDVRTVRIGNQVKDENGNIVVLVASNLLAPVRFSGISITPVNLDLLRFTEDHGSTCWVRYSASPLRIFKDPAGYYYLENFPNGKLEYTHQLQNLILDLTGEETPEFDQAVGKPFLKKGNA
jgi:hypothetical protein